MERIHKSSEIIADLLEINKERKAGFKKVLEKSESDEDLQYLFNSCIEETDQNIAELQKILPGKTRTDDDEGSTTGKLHRAWIELRLLFTEGDRKTILKEVLRGEEAFEEVYTEALTTSSGVDAKLLPVLNEQAGKQRSFLAKLQQLIDKLDTD